LKGLTEADVTAEFASKEVAASPVKTKGLGSSSKNTNDCGPNQKKKKETI
jgi:hypothetical protein